MWMLLQPESRSPEIITDLKGLHHTQMSRNQELNPVRILLLLRALLLAPHFADTRQTIKKHNTCWNQWRLLLIKSIAFAHCFWKVSFFYTKLYVNRSCGLGGSDLIMLLTCFNTQPGKKKLITASLFAAEDLTKLPPSPKARQEWGICVAQLSVISQWLSLALCSFLSLGG